MTTAVPASVVNVVEQMSEVDREAFLLLLNKLRRVNNDPEQLTAEDKALMRDIGQRNKELMQLLNPTQEPGAEAPRYAHSEVSTAFLKTEFYLFVREQLLAEWCVHGGSLEDAVLHAFQQKWVPEILKDEIECQKIFARHQRDIEAANAFRKSVQDGEAIVEDKKMAVGLAWFTTLFKLHQLIERGVDLSAP